MRNLGDLHTSAHSGAAAWETGDHTEPLSFMALRWEIWVSVPLDQPHLPVYTLLCINCALAALSLLRADEALGDSVLH